METSIWLDYIERSFVQDELSDLIKGLTIDGLTSNPSIFSKAIENPIYREDLGSELDPKMILEDIMVCDIRLACDKFLPLYEKDNSKGLVSLELDPSLAHDTNKTIFEARRLFEKVNRKNLMIKIPATKEANKSIESLLKDGININATLVFSPLQVQELSNIFDSINTKAQMVISVFVSRFDRVLDLELPKELHSKAGIFNAYRCYEKASANVMMLFASTSNANKDLPSTYYLQELLLDSCIITAPLELIRDIRALPNLAKKTINMQNVDDYFDKIENLGINFVKICDNLHRQGLEQFSLAFNEMIKSIQRYKDGWNASKG